MYCMCVNYNEANAFFFFHIRVMKMTQNMFHEGLYHVFFKDSCRTSAQTSSSSVPTNARIHRWFRTVVNTRLLVSGVCGVALWGSSLAFDLSFLLIKVFDSYLSSPLRCCRSSVALLAY